MNTKRLSIAAIVAVALTGLSASAMAATPEEEQELYNDCAAKATTAGFTPAEANTMCIKMVAKVLGETDRAKLLQGFKLKKTRPMRITTKRLRIRRKSSRY